MSMEELVVVVKNFYFSHTYIALAIVIGLVIFIYCNPKDAFKILGAFLVFLLVIYGFSILGKSSSRGFKNEKKMINQSVDRMQKM